MTPPSVTFSASLILPPGYGFRAAARTGPGRADTYFLLDPEYLSFRVNFDVKFKTVDVEFSFIKFS